MEILFSFVGLGWTQSKKKTQKDPSNRSRTSDLEISVVAIYSLPLCQLSYTRSDDTMVGVMLILKLLCPTHKAKKKSDAVCGDRTHALTNMRLKHAP